MMGLLAVIVIYLMERENGKKEAVKSVKMVLLVILFLLWLVLCPFIGMATLMSISDVSVEQGVAAQIKFWGVFSLPFILACCGIYYGQRRAGSVNWKMVLYPLKIYVLLLLFLIILPVGFVLLILWLKTGLL